MASQPRTSASEEERRLNMRTLVIASIASASAAVITSQFWTAGTWMAAALTPVIVALVSELLHRPTAVVAERVTANRPRIKPDPGAPAPRRDRQAPAPPRDKPRESTVSMYRSGSRRFPAPRRKLAIGVIAVTAAIAFAITAIAITGTELVTGGSIGKGERDTTLFGGGRGSAEQQPESQGSPSDGESSQPRETPESQPKQDAPKEEQPPAQEEPAPTPNVPEAPQAPGME